MIIEIGNHKIVSDSRQFIVQENSIVQEGDNKGNEYWSNVAYYKTLNHSLKHITTKAVLRNDDAQSIIAALRQVEKKIDEFVRLLK